MPQNTKTIKNMIKADYVLIADTSVGEFEVIYLQERPVGTLGMRQLIAGVNKMNSNELLQHQNAYKEIITEVITYFKKTDYNPDTTAFMPISGWNGDNMLEPRGNMTWFKGWTITCGNGNSSGITGFI